MCTTVRLASALLVAAAVLTGSAPAHASCAEAPPARPRLTASDHVFAGSVTRVTHGGAAAEVDVTDVWHGPDLPPEVVVVGGQLAQGAGSSTDRSFRAGERYAFFVTRADDGSLRDNACSPTAALSARAAVDPPGVRPPVADADAPTDLRGVLGRTGAPGLLVLLLAATAAAVGVLARRGRRRRGRPARGGAHRSAASTWSTSGARTAQARAADRRTTSPTARP